MQQVTPPRAAQRPVRRDPAPSRLNYRVQRWMLTPMFRRGLRLGVPLVMALVCAGAFLGDGRRRAEIAAYATEQWEAFRQRPEFQVRIVAIDGVEGVLYDGIRKAVAVELPVSSFDLDLEGVRSRILRINAVKSASVRIRSGGVLQIDVAERKPVAVWRRQSGGVILVDEEGVPISRIENRLDWPELPLIAGKGADVQVPQALMLVDAAQPLRERFRGLVRVGERRWDVVLDRDQRILLPEERPVWALERIIALSDVHDMLERDVAVVDLRIAERPTIRMSEEAVKDWWRIREINGDGQ